MDYAKARREHELRAGVRGVFIPKYILVAVDIIQGFTMLILPAVDSVEKAVAFGACYGVAQGARGLV
jgi:hypothetical protein